MCGIAGIVVTGGGDVSAARLLAARNMLEHRGPDGHSLWTNGTHTVALVHTRLAIVDLAGGQQPIPNEDGSVQVVFNGEIYNHIELRSHLEARGHRFRTRCDTEVLVHLYEQYGADLCTHLNGMFAFAIWDEAKQILLLGRDRLGKKPLYFFCDENKLLFASELKALYALLDRQPRVDPRAIYDYLTFKYVPHERELLAGVQQLAPGHYLTWHHGVPRPLRYWSYPEPQEDFFRGVSFAAAAQHLRELLRDATRLRLRSDVPVGVLLSGGIDSALIVGLIAEAGVRPIQTFTASFAEHGPDERPYARAVAERFGTEHRELCVAAPSRDLVYRVLDQFDEPFADTSAIPTYLICQQACQFVKVALTGDGGDESFLGYTRYAQLRRYLRQRRWLHPLLRVSGLSALGRWLCPEPRHRTLRRRFRTLTNLWQPGPAEVYERWYASFSRELKHQLCRSQFRDLLGDAIDTAAWMTNTLTELSATDPVAAAAAFDLRHYLPDAVLTKVDRASMAHGLECRSPLLDYRVVEFAARLPTNWRLHPQHGSKWILRVACRDLLPDKIWERSKMGFGAPVGDWLRRDMSEEFLRDCLPAHGLEQWLDRSVVERLIRDHRQRTEDHTYRLWTLLALNRFWARLPVQEETK